MDQRIHFISDYLKKVHTVNGLCSLYGISRKTGYKWIKRYEEHGAEGLKEGSRRPLHCPHQTPYRVRQAVIALRKKYSWGPKKLRHILEKQHPAWDIPARSTVCDILRKEGLVPKRRVRRRVPPYPQPFAPVSGPNDVWTVDYKGHFRLGNGRYCYPLTIVDLHSRYVLACEGLEHPSLPLTKRVFKRVFKEYGLPQRIRSDNGTPFVSTSTNGLSRLSVWWIRLGIYPERIRPGNPQENGSHERMHRSLKEKTVRPPASSFRVQQRRFNMFCKEYNTERPHEALNMVTPKERYISSERPMPKRLPPLEYPGHFDTQIVNQNGCICRNNTYAYIGYILTGQLLGLNEVDDGIWEVYLNQVLIAHYSEKMNKIYYPAEHKKCYLCP
jgi:transposase InsO family protein